MEPTNQGSPNWDRNPVVKDENPRRSHSDILKTLDNTLKLGIECSEVGQKTILAVYEQSNKLVDAEKDLDNINNKLNKAEKSIQNMEDACKCILF